jgi:hypothetical protein
MARHAYDRQFINLSQVENTLFSEYVIDPEYVLKPNVHWTHLKTTEGQNWNMLHCW